MTTLKKIASNGNNALESTGPQTPGGKAISSKNAMKHGLLSKDILLPNESADLLHEFERALREILQPVGELEELLFQKIVFCDWRLCRFAKVEAGIFSWHVYQEQAERAEQKARSYEKTLLDGLLEKDITIMDERKREEALVEANEARSLQTESSTLGSAFMREASGADAFSKLSRYETTIERALYRALHELQRLQAARAGLSVPPPVAVDIEVDLAAPAEKVG